MDSQDNTGPQLDKQPATPTQEPRRHGLSFSFEIGDGVLKMLLAVILVFVVMGERVGCAPHDDEPAKSSTSTAMSRVDLNYGALVAPGISTSEIERGK